MAITFVKCVLFSRFECRMMDNTQLRTSNMVQALGAAEEATCPNASAVFTRQGATISDEFYRTQSIVFEAFDPSAVGNGICGSYIDTVSSSLFEIHGQVVHLTQLVEHMLSTTATRFRFPISRYEMAAVAKSNRVHFKGPPVSSCNTTNECPSKTEHTDCAQVQAVCTGHYASTLYLKNIILMKACFVKSTVTSQ